MRLLAYLSPQASIQFTQDLFAAFRCAARHGLRRIRGCTKTEQDRQIDFFDARLDSDAGGTYRAVYTVKFEAAVFVLHCFQKKSKRGIATPREDMNIIRARLKVAEALAKEL